MTTIAFKPFDGLVMKEMLEDAELLSIEPQHGVVGLRWAIKIEPPLERIALDGRLVYGWRERSPLCGQSKRAKRRAQLRKVATSLASSTGRKIGSDIGEAK